MVNAKKRTYIIAFIILALVLLGSAILVWDLVIKNHKQQDKIYSGAKLVFIKPQNITIDNDYYNG